MVGGNVCERALDKLSEGLGREMRGIKGHNSFWLSLAPFGSPEETRILLEPHSVVTDRIFYSYKFKYRVNVTHRAH